MLKIPLQPKDGPVRGFTLIEVIVVLILLGILSVVAIARALDNDVEVRTAADNLKVHLRHAQIRAMNSDVSWGVHSTGNGYVLFHSGSVANTARFLGENNETVPLPGGSGFTVSFDQWGRPYNAANPATATPLTANLTVTVNDGTHAASLTIIPDTGYIP